MTVTDSCRIETLLLRSDSRTKHKIYKVTSLIPIKCRHTRYVGYIYIYINLQLLVSKYVMTKALYMHIIIFFW